MEHKLLFITKIKGLFTTKLFLAIFACDAHSNNMIQFLWNFQGCVALKAPNR